MRLSSVAEIGAMIGGGWRVLDAGSGDRPFPLATVLLDHLPRQQETAAGVRTENPAGRIVRDDKPFVAGRLETLPFGDRAFDFVYASHVLEHVEEPGVAISELERVAPRGYIEVPRAWFEFVDGSPFHRWLIDFTGDELQFRPKGEEESRFIESRRLFDVDARLFSRFYGPVFASVDPAGTSVEKSMCFICVYWEGAIPYRILPPHVYRREHSGGGE